MLTQLRRQRLHVDAEERRDLRRGIGRVGDALGVGVDSARIRGDRQGDHVPVEDRSPLGGKLDRAYPLLQAEGVEGCRPDDLEHDEPDRDRSEEQGEDEEKNDEP